MLLVPRAGRDGQVGRYGWSVLSEINPRLIYASGSGYGISGRMRTTPRNGRHRPGSVRYDECHRVSGQPSVKCGPAVVDFLSGSPFYAGIMTALYERTFTNKGRLVEGRDAGDCLSHARLEFGFRLRQRNCPSAHETATAGWRLLLTMSIRRQTASSRSSASMKRVGRTCSPRWAEDLRRSPLYIEGTARAAHQHRWVDFGMDQPAHQGRDGKIFESDTRCRRHRCATSLK